MRVVINGLAALKPKTGVGHHTANLAEALVSGFPEDTFALYPGKQLGHWVRKFQTGKAKPASPARGNAKSSVRAGLKDFAKSTAKAASGLHFAAYTRTLGFDLYHEPNFVPFPSPLPTVVTVHDLSVVRFPQWHPADRVKVHDRHFHKGLRRAAHVIVVSEAVRRELIEMTGMTPDRVTAIYNGISPAFRPMAPEETAPVREQLKLPERYFLCVGTIEPRKNVGTVMRAFCDLPAEVRERCPLALVGPWGWKSDADRTYYETTAKDRGVRHLGYVADAQMPALFAGSIGLVYPTYYEGFGIPPVEMLAAGRAVLGSTAAAVREVCGPHAEFIEPENVSAWRDSMMRLAQVTEHVDRSAAVEYARTFNWPRIANETMAVYRKVLAQSGRRISQ